MSDADALARKRQMARERNARWRAANPERAAATQQRFREANRARLRTENAERMRAYRKANPGAQKAADRRYAEKNRAKIRTRKLAYYYENHEREKAHRAASRRRNPEKFKAAIDRWVARNPDRVKTYAKTFREKPENKAKHAAWVAARNAQKRRATPLWADFAAMDAVYAEAARLTRETSEPWEVDHEVPLISKRVCGLHCEANLRPLRASENRSKGNRFWEHMA